MPVMHALAAGAAVGTAVALALAASRVLFRPGMRCQLGKARVSGAHNIQGEVITLRHTDTHMMSIEMTTIPRR